MNTNNGVASLRRRLLALASPAAESLSDKQRLDEFVDAAIETAGVLALKTKEAERLAERIVDLERRNRELMSTVSMMCGDA